MAWSDHIRESSFRTRAWVPLGAFCKQVTASARLDRIMSGTAMGLAVLIGGTCVSDQMRAATDNADSCHVEASEDVYRLSAENELVMMFVARPAPNASEAELREFFVYAIVLGRYASKKLHDLTVGQCDLTERFDYGQLELAFGYRVMARRPHDRCQVYDCLNRLTRILQLTQIESVEFSATINTIIRGIKTFEQSDLRLPMLSATRAAREAYKHIYPARSRERVFLDLSAEQFEGLNYEAFAAWHASQQSAIRDVVARRSEPRTYIDELRRFERRNDDDGQKSDCANPSDLDVARIDVERRGWGHETIILISYARKRELRAKIENASLRILCDPRRVDLEQLAGSVWREMADQLTCFRQEVNKDPWLVLFSKGRRMTVSESLRYAEVIAGGIRGDVCVDRRMQIVVVGFGD